MSRHLSWRMSSQPHSPVFKWHSLRNTLGIRPRGWGLPTFQPFFLLALCKQLQASAPEKPIFPSKITSQLTFISQNKSIRILTFYYTPHCGVCGLKTELGLSVLASLPFTFWASSSAENPHNVFWTWSKHNLMNSKSQMGTMISSDLQPQGLLDFPFLSLSSKESSISDGKTQGLSIKTFPLLLFVQMEE